MQISDDHLGGVVTGRTGHAATGVGACAAQVQAGNDTTIIRLPDHGPCAEQLVERQRAVEDVATNQAEGALQVHRRQHLPAQNGLRKSGRVLVYGRDHQVGHFITVVIPTASA